MKRVILSLGTAVMLLLCSCGGNEPHRDITLESKRDTLSYSAGMYAAQHLSSMVYDEMGVTESTLDEFVAGVRASYPINITPESKAYAYGLSLGAATMDMLEKSGNIVNAGPEGLDTQLFLEGIIAAVCGNSATLEARFAADYCNRNKYLAKSEEFMQKNRRRSNVTTLPSGLQYKVDVMGQGAVATASDVVLCRYKGTNINGEVFDTSGDEAVSFPVSEVIPGFAEALRLFPVGTQCTLYIPWQLAYGAEGLEGVIPPYSTLVFELEIMDIKK